MKRALALAGLAAAAWGQTSVLNQGAHRMEIVLERGAAGGEWRAVDPSLVLAANDRIRFRFRTNFEGYLYVTNQGTSGRYRQLFPSSDALGDNHVGAGQEYLLPTGKADFRVTGPPGMDIVYWLVSPIRMADLPRLFPGPASPGQPAKPPTLLPRCDDAVLQARGDCVDHAAGLKLVPRDALPQSSLSEAAGRAQRDLVFLREQDTAVVSAPAPLTGPVIYQFVLAHR
ncbi:MAG: DUF4384 domain-containing protein [Bryobacteraceae bacterium]